VPGGCGSLVAVGVLDLKLPVIDRIQNQVSRGRAAVTGNRIDAPGQGSGSSRTSFGIGEAAGFGVVAGYLPDIVATSRTTGWRDIERVDIVARIGREGPGECRRQAGGAA